MATKPEIPDWLKDKTIIHIGNIANNAHNAATYERSLGLRSFAVSPDYMHLMGFPFWETDELVAEVSDHFNPQPFITETNMPEWFLWGPWIEIKRKLDEILRPVNVATKVKLSTRLLELLKRLMSATLEGNLRLLRRPLKFILPSWFRHWLANTFLFKARQVVGSGLQGIFDGADIISFYGPHNAFAFPCEVKQQYITTEHGTLRDFIWSDYSFAKESREAYFKSNKILITNQDCYGIALSKMKVEPGKLIKTPHPACDEDFELLRNLRLGNIEAGKISGILMPTRHSYPNEVDRGKGTQAAMDAIVLAVKKFPHLHFILCEYGDDPDRSKAFLARNNVDKNVSWAPIVSRKLLKKNMTNYLAILDQFETPSYGAITADAIGLGIPVLTAHDPDLDISFFGSPAPVLACSNPAEILVQIERLLTERGIQERIYNESTHWYDNNLHSNIAFQRRLIAYQSIILNND